MIIDKSSSNRLCIYFFYDNEGIVDDYVFQMLDGLKPNSKEIAFVSNGALTGVSREKLEDFGINVFERDNSGFDVWAYKHVIDSYGWDKLSEFDEIILTNFTIAGPVYPLSDMFKEMSSKDLDFWGITVSYGEQYHKHGVFDNDYMLTHLQSHFITVRKPMFDSEPFKNYWNNMDEINNYDDSVSKHEAVFTDHFEKQGFKWEPYVDSAEFESITTYPLMFFPKKMIEQKKCPIFKRKLLFLPMEDIAHSTYGDLAGELLSVLNDMGFDIKPIMENVIRTGKNMALRSALGEVKVVPSKPESIDKAVASDKKNAILLKIQSKSYLDMSLPYLKSISETIDVQFFFTDTEVKSYAEQLGSVGDNFKLFYLEDNNSWIKALTSCSKDYDNVICFSFIEPIISRGDGLSVINYQKFQLESLIGNNGQLENTLNLLQSGSEFEGLYFPLPPNFGPYKLFEDEVWRSIFETSFEINNCLNLREKINIDENVFGPKGGNFIIKGSLLRSIDYTKLKSDITKKADFELSFFNLLPLLVQQKGIISSYLTNDTLAEFYCNMSLYNTYKKEVRVEPEFVHLNIYFDTGSGFNEAEKVNKTLGLSDFKDITLKFEFPKDTKLVRFDPVEGHGFRCENLSFRVGKIDIPVLNTNCARFNNVDFCAFVDPHYVVEVPKSDSTDLTITMDDIKIFEGISLEQERYGLWANILGTFGQQKVHYDHLISTIREENTRKTNEIARLDGVNNQLNIEKNILNSTLNEIYNSRSYRFVKSFTKIKDKFTSKK